MVFRRPQLRPTRSRTAALATLALCTASVFAWAGAQDAEPNAYAILAHVKAALRTHERPPYVAYTLARRDALNGLPDLANSYSLRIWCRTADNRALSRRMFGSRVHGAAELITPAFDKPIDPGPPTADLLDVIREQQPARAQPTASPSSTSPPVIGSVSVIIETAYHVVFAGSDRRDYHLRLEARHDPDHNRLTDLYVDRETYAVHRAVAHDHLYIEGRAVPERFEIEFGSYQGLPVITAIHGQTDYAESPGLSNGEALHEVDYRFDNLAFPADLPAWYFDPAQLGAHRDELPEISENSKRL